MEKRSSKINEYNILGINIQIVLTILVCVFTLIGFFVNSWYFIIMRILIGLDLFIMAFNNERVYHNKKLTIIYIVIGVLMIIYGLLNIFGVM